VKALALEIVKRIVRRLFIFPLSKDLLKERQRQLPHRVDNGKKNRVLRYRVGFNREMKLPSGVPMHDIETIRYDIALNFGYIAFPTVLLLCMVK